MRSDYSSVPVFAAALGVGVLSCMDALMKTPSMTYPLGEVVGLRYSTAAAFAALAFLVAGERLPSLGALRRNASRAVVMLANGACFFTALARLPLAECIALTFMAPLFLALLGRVILKEPISPNAMTGVLLGLVGVVIIAGGTPMRGGDAFDIIGIASALGCAFFYALSNVLMRQQTSRNSLHTIVFLSNCCAAVFSLPFLAVQWQRPSLADLSVVTLAGLLGTCGHFCMAWAYARAQAGRLGILEYSAFLWASVLGFVFFAEVPSLATVVGAGLILLACLGSTGVLGQRIWHRRPKS